MARPIKVGDRVVVARDDHADELAKFYGDAARRPFVVEAVLRGTGRYACVGGGVMVWRSHLRLVRTKLQLIRDAQKAAS